jgi:hypothetical protein
MKVGVEFEIGKIKSEMRGEITIDVYISDLTIIGGIVGAGVILMVIGIMVKRRRAVSI